MAKDTKGSGRIYMMVGLVAAVMIPLAIIAPGLSNQVADRDVQRLGPVEPDGDGEVYRSELPDQAQPVSGSGSQSSFGAAGSFGQPMMDAGPTNALYSDQLPQYEPPADTPSPTRNAAPAGVSDGATVVRSQSEAERTGAAAMGLPINASRTISSPARKPNAPPISTQKAPKVE